MPARPTRRVVLVGQDITAPAAVASGGTIRIRSQNAATVATWFGLGKAPKPPRRGGRSCKRLPASPAGNAPADAPHQVRLPLAAGTITLITGPSGAGKSTLLRALREPRPAPGGAQPDPLPPAQGAKESRGTCPSKGDIQPRSVCPRDRHIQPRDQDLVWIDLAAIDPPDVPIVDCFGDEPLTAILKRLGHVGLGEAWSYLRTPPELSEGQRFRLKLAMAMCEAARVAASPGRGRAILVCDEFAAVLDRLTAMIVARCVRRAIAATPQAAAVVATSHEDLRVALAPDVVVHCDFGTARVEAGERQRD